VIALAGNPNCGKTTVFNELTGSHQHVGNWPGVTVERKEGEVSRDGVNYRIVDLPGIYSLSPHSLEEVVARDFLIDGGVDVVVNVVDAGNLERNLYLTTQLLELGIPVVVALNMIDMSERMGQHIDIDRFSEFLGVPVLTVVASRGEGIDEITRAAARAAEDSRSRGFRGARYGPEVETELGGLADRLGLGPDDAENYRWMLVKSLEGDTAAQDRLRELVGPAVDTARLVDATRKHLASGFGSDIEVVFADGRYGFVEGLMRETVRRTERTGRTTVSDRIDNVLLHRFAGIPIFLVLMWLTFKLTFDLGAFFVNYLEMAVAAATTWVATALPSGPIESMIVDGVIPGVGGVVVFVPNIAIMFVIISFLEDSGYMARAAFLMDKAMHTLGLHGKSFIPMLMGFGCNVPAVMATRTLETREDRLLTILITPLMSCTARLPIYVLFTGIFFSRGGAWVIFSIYALGVLLAVATGKILRRVFFQKSVSPFVMELPPYRVPTLKGTVIHVWERTALFLSKAGTVILAAAVVIWALGTLPWGVEFGSPESLVGRLGRAIEPVVTPLGMDWRAAVALLFGLGAKEIVVSTLGVLYGFSHESGEMALSGSFSPLTAFVFMVVSLIYIPCVATIAAIKRETNSWKWTVFAVAYSFGLAYLVGFGFYRIGILLGLE